MAKKYYTVWVGVTPGVYDSWAACQLQTKGYPDARFKSYKSKAEAEYAYKNGAEEMPTRSNKSKTKKTNKCDPAIDQSAIAVDAACSGNPGKMEYQGVYVADQTQLFHFGPVQDGTNNIGEFLALVHALALLQKNNTDQKTIYTDSRTALAWVRKKKANTKLKKTKRNQELFELIARAESWLKTHTIKHKIVKWETKKWGEIPADFGRK